MITSANMDAKVGRAAVRRKGAGAYWQLRRGVVKWDSREGGRKVAGRWQGGRMGL